MSCCFNFLMERFSTCWTRSLTRLLLRMRSWALVFELYHVARMEGPKSQNVIVKCHKVRCCTSGTETIYVVRSKHEKGHLTGSGKVEVKESLLNGSVAHSARYSSNGKSKTASLFTQQGGKGINQDAMLVLENFGLQEDTVFCGVFDGHGQDGHLVARNVRDGLPKQLASVWKSSYQAYRESITSLDDSEGDTQSPAVRSYLADSRGNPGLITTWKESFVKAYKLMDRELLLQDGFDCVSSGTTAVTVVKQGNDLIVGNVGDSRAVLGTRNDENALLALQLTMDLKPDVPREAERIKRFKGRIFALRDEPSVKRVWLPNRNAPGLAMARALGDYCLKNYGVISEPEVSYRRLDKKDEFVVLATDGVWDVLSNQQVVDIVASVSNKSTAARAVVDQAVLVWRSKHATSKVDDCAVVCLFLNDSITSCH